MGTHSAKLLGGDSPVAILVEKGEGLLELSDLLLSKLVCNPEPSSSAPLPCPSDITQFLRKLDRARRVTVQK